MNKVFDFFLKIFGFAFKGRTGLDQFTNQYGRIAGSIVENLFKVRNGAGLHTWKDDARNQLVSRLKLDGQSIRDNWVEILIAGAYETVLAKAESQKK